MARLFGTDGVRGIAGRELTCELAMNIGKACAFVLTKSKKNVKVIIGNDGRESATMIVSSLIAGFTSVGVDIMDIGIIPTPAISYLIEKYDMDAGVMVTASHNPYEYNGIKIFDSNGYKLPDELEDEIEACVNNEIKYNNKKIGKLLDSKDGIDDYIDYLINTNKYDFSGLNIAIDCANGASSVTASKLFNKTNCNYHIINNNPNGTNINNNCGALHIEKLSKYVLDNKLDGGVAFDGDADRAIFINELGNVMDGDYVLAILGKDLKDNKNLTNNTIVGTIMSNLGFIKFCKNNDINFIATKVGDRYVLEEMIVGNFVLGGEQSGHIILKNHAKTGDGQLTAITLFEALKRSGKKFSELANIIKKYPQVLINAKVSNERKNEFYYLFEGKSIFLTVILVIGCLLFAKEVPKLIEDMLGIKLDGMTLKPIKKFQEQTLFGKQITSLGAAGLAGGAAFAANTYANKGNIFSGIAGAGSAFARGTVGAFKGQNFGQVFL